MWTDKYLPTNYSESDVCSGFHLKPIAVQNMDRAPAIFF